MPGGETEEPASDLLVNGSDLWQDLIWELPLTIDCLRGNFLDEHFVQLLRSLTMRGADVIFVPISVIWESFFPGKARL